MNLSDWVELGIGIGIGFVYPIALFVYVGLLPL